MHTAEELREWLGTFSYKDFHKGRIEQPNVDLKDGDLFITDYYGNDLSLCKKITPRKKIVKRWRDEVQFIEVLIPDCNKKIRLTDQRTVHNSRNTFIVS